MAPRKNNVADKKIHSRCMCCHQIYCMRIMIYGSARSDNLTARLQKLIVIFAITALKCITRIANLKSIASKVSEVNRQICSYF